MASKSRSGVHQKQIPLQQLGSINEPLQIIDKGFPGDTTKKCYSCTAIITHADSIDLIQSIESKISRDNPGLKLNSSLSRCTFPRRAESKSGEPASDDELIQEEAWKLRFKMSKNEDYYECRNTWENGSATCLEMLSYGQTVVIATRHEAWKRGNECGVVFYANRTIGLGEEVRPRGRHPPPVYDWS